MPFTGFHRGTLYTPVPNPFFGHLLEEIQDLAEFKVTLRGLWLLHNKKDWPKVLYLEEFLSDLPLLRGLGTAGTDPRDEIRRGLGLAVSRGAFLERRLAGETLAYALNSDAGRAALDQLKNADKHNVMADSPLPGGMEEVPLTERPNIFAMYEDNIGTITPMLAEELREAEERYPWSWVNEAFTIAVNENKRSWRYVSGILRRWTAQGKEDGKPGRHTQKDQRQKHLQDYQRRWGGSS